MVKFISIRCPRATIEDLGEMTHIWQWLFDEEQYQKAPCSSVIKKTLCTISVVHGPDGKMIKFIHLMEMIKYFSPPAQFFFNFQMLHWLESFCFNWWIIYYLAAQCTLFPKAIMMYHCFAFDWVSWWLWSCHIDREVQTGDQGTRKLFKFYFVKEKTKKILLICILVIESVPCKITLLSVWKIVLNSQTQLLKNFGSDRLNFKSMFYHWILKKL